jgi:septal ring factor EnvC (AmiA/AmiB activator)
VNHTDSGTADRATGSPALETVDHLKALLAAHRQREFRLAEQIVRLESDLADLRSNVAAATGQLKRLKSRYTAVLGPDGQIDNAQRLYELLARDARQIGQELSLSLPVNLPRQPFNPLP